MASGRKNQLTKQIGEYLVAAELCRRGFIATTFTGNVPDFDIIATNEAFETIPIQVKTIRQGAWQLDAKKLLNITIENGVQRIIDKLNLPNLNMVCIFVKIISQGNDEFYIFRLVDLQEVIFEVHSQVLEKHGGRRPKNENSTHIAVNPNLLERFKNNWDLITNQT
jgi:hypothetical protein